MSILIKDTDIHTLHFVGAFGIGMSAIAQYLCPEINVTGSDRGLHSPHTLHLKEKLEECGCTLFEQDGSGITDETSAIVISTAIEKSNPDYQAAEAKGVTILHRSEVLAALVAKAKTISVTGTSGKSTVSSMIFHILHEAGLSPSYIGGANLHSLKDKGFIGNAYRGSSDLLIIEADESDGTVVNYHPHTTVILNISKDHKSEEEIIALMHTAANQSHTVILNAEDSHLEDFSGTTFGIDEGDFHAKDIQSKGAQNSFTIKDRTFTVNFPGRHTIANATAATAAATVHGISIEQCAKALESYRGVERRFDIYTNNETGIQVIDDYAHNPEKVAAAIQAAREVSSPLTVLFQPHGFGPLKFLLNEFAKSFANALTNEDRLILLPVYYAGGTVDRSVDSHTLAETISTKISVIAVEDREEALKEITAAQNNTIVLLGARDQSLPTFAKEICNSIEVSK